MIWLVATTWAATVAVTTTVDEGPVPDSALRAAVWHTLSVNGHEPVFVDPDADLAEQLATHRIPTHYRVDVAWHATGTWDDSRVVVSNLPLVTVTESVMVDGILRRGKYTTVTADPALYDVDGEVLYLPEATLHGALDQAVTTFLTPPWSHTEAEVVVPVVIAGGPRYRQQDDWAELASERVRHASALLGPAGVELEVVAFEAWTPDGEKLDALLHDLTATPRSREGALRVGFVELDRVESTGHTEDVGRSWVGGRDLVVVDQPPVAGRANQWDVADEGIAIAHETLHALGLDHVDETGFVMSAVHTTLVHELSPQTLSVAAEAARRFVSGRTARSGRAALGQQATPLPVPSAPATVQADPACVNVQSIWWSCESNKGSTD